MTTFPNSAMPPYNPTAFGAPTGPTPPMSNPMTPPPMMNPPGMGSPMSPMAGMPMQPPMAPPPPPAAQALPQDVVSLGYNRALEDGRVEAANTFKYKEPGKLFSFKNLLLAAGVTAAGLFAWNKVKGGGAEPAAYEPKNQPEIQKKLTALQETTGKIQGVEQAEKALKEYDVIPDLAAVDGVLKTTAETLTQNPGDAAATQKQDALQKAKTVLQEAGEKPLPEYLKALQGTAEEQRKTLTPVVEKLIHDLGHEAEHASSSDKKAIEAYTTQLKKQLADVGIDPETLKTGHEHHHGSCGDAHGAKKPEPPAGA